MVSADMLQGGCLRRRPPVRQCGNERRLLSLYLTSETWTLTPTRVATSRDHSRTAEAERTCGEMWIMLLQITASHSLVAPPPSPVPSPPAGCGHLLGSEHTSNTNGGRMLLYCPPSMVPKMSGIRVSSNFFGFHEGRSRQAGREAGRGGGGGTGKRQGGSGSQLHRVSRVWMISAVLCALRRQVC